MITQPICRSWITIYVVENGQDGSTGPKGDNAEFYDFNVLTEKFIVYIDSNNPNGTAVVQLQYNIHHVNGNTTEVVNSSASGYHIRFRRNDVSSTYYSLSNGVSNPNYTNNSFITNFHNQTSKPDYLIVELCQGSSHTVLKQRIVPLVYNTGLLFDINASLNSITSTVQGHSSSLEDLLNRQVGGRNFARGTSDQWSDWISLSNSNNQTISLGDCYLPANKEIGDNYTSQIIIQYSSVEASNDGTFRITAQAKMDNQWGMHPFWDNQLIYVTSEPEDGVYRYSYTYKVDSSNIDKIVMSMGLRVDYALGSLRYKCIKVEKGNTATDWTVNPDDIDSSIISVTNSMSQISQTMDQIQSTVSSHTANINTLNSSLSSVQDDMSQLSQRADQIQSTVTSINSSISGINSSISSITQRSDSIESTVKSLRTGQTNYFHFTGTTWQNVIPWIQGYGIVITYANGSHDLYRVSNLGFNGEGGDFVVSCEIKSSNFNTNVTVDLCDRIAEDEEGTFKLSANTWVKKSFRFKNVNNYITPGNYNGFIDFYYDKQTSNSLYVKNIMITRGQVAQEFVPSVLDIENHSSNEIIDNYYLEYCSELDEKFKGYKVYSPSEYSTTSNTYKDYIYKNNLALKTNTVYTLSFWACSTTSDVVMASYLHGNGGPVTCGVPPVSYSDVSIAGQITCGNPQDGATFSYLGSTYKHYIIHWYNQNAGNRNLIVMRVNKDWWKTETQPNVKITGIEFREGYWVEDNLNTQSMIRQTASEIELKVNSTGINIQDGTITLNADRTNIVGNLNIYDASQGLIIYDSYKNPKITVQNDTIGTLDNFNLGSDKQYIEHRTGFKYQGFNYIEFLIQDISLGDYNAGETITIHDLYVAGGFVNNYFNTEFSYLHYECWIFAGSGTQLQVTTGDVSQGNGDRALDFKIPDMVQSTYNNSHKFQIKIKFYFTGNSANYVGNFRTTVSFYLRRTASSINKIAIDGGVFASSPSQYNWFGSDKTQLRNGQAIFRLDNNHLLRNTYNPDDATTVISSTFSDISSTVPYQIINSLTHTATLFASFICFSTVVGQSDSAQRTLYLPEPQNSPGKVYYVKNIVGDDTRVYTINQTSNAFLNPNSTSKVTYINTSNESYMFISCGLYWITFRMS